MTQNDTSDISRGMLCLILRNTMQHGQIALQVEDV